MDLRLHIRFGNSVFNRVYRPFLDTAERFNVFYGGAGSGKSVFVAQKMIIKALRAAGGGRRILVVRKVADTLRDSIYAELLEQLGRFGIRDYCKASVSPMSIALPGGSVFLFKGMDSPEKIKSISGIDDIVIEEATELTKEDFAQLNLRLRSMKPNPQIHLMFNPVSKNNWVYGYFFKDGPPPNTRILRTTWRDNRFLPPGYGEELERMSQSDPAYHRVYALGEFGSLDRLVYQNWEVGEFTPKELGGNYALKAGLDFGFSNSYTALAVLYVCAGERRIMVWDEHYARGMLSGDIAQVLREKKLLNEVIRADSEDMRVIGELRQLGARKVVPAGKGPGSVIAGIAKAQQFRLVVHPRCVNFLAELESYAWEKDRESGEYRNAPVKENDHLMDAMRYAMEGVSFASGRKNYSGKGSRIPTA